MSKEQPQVGLIMGSQSDWETMSLCAELMDQLGIAFEAEVVSAHRTPEKMFEYAATAESRGIQVIIAAAGGAAHLPGMVAAKTALPVIGVPIDSSPLQGWDALLATVPMPPGVPVATVSVGKAGAANAAVLAVQILALSDANLASRLDDYKNGLAEKVEKAAAKVEGI